MWVYEPQDCFNIALQWLTGAVRVIDNKTPTDLDILSLMHQIEDIRKIQTLSEEYEYKHNVKITEERQPK